MTAVPLPLKFPTPLSSPKVSSQSSNHCTPFRPMTLRSIHSAKSSSRYITRAIEEGRKESLSETASLIESVPETPIEPENRSAESEVEVSDLGKEIKKAMEERKEKTTNDLLSGVLEEVREIEWPAFQKVLSTTGVVLGVIAGSSVVLLTLNAVLAELSDKVFAGRGVQDFLS